MMLQILRLDHLRLPQQQLWYISGACI